MASFTECLERFNKFFTPYYVDSLLRHLFRSCKCAEDGLRDKKIGKAAKTECYVYYKSLLVVESIMHFIGNVFSDGHQRDAAEPRRVKLPHREILLADECPDYLAIFREYISVFADNWFDEDAHRDQFFDDIFNAFRLVVTYVFVFTETDWPEKPEYRRAYTWFLRDFQGTARLIDSAERSDYIQSLLDNFDIVVPHIRKTIEKLSEREKGFLSEKSGLVGIYRISGFLKMLHKDAAFSREKDEMLSRSQDDHRSTHVPHDSRYDGIERHMWLWSEMPPSVIHFIEGCKLLESAAVLASKETYDYNFSNRPFVQVLLLSLAKHPKNDSASCVAESIFTEEEKSNMSVAFKSMAIAFVRLRNRLRSSVGFGEADIDTYDQFISQLPHLFGNCEQDFKALLFDSKPANDNDGFNVPLLDVLADGASPLAIISEPSYQVMKHSKEINAALLNAYKSGNKDYINATIEKIENKYIPAVEKKKPRIVKSDLAKELEIRDWEPPRELPEPGPNDRIAAERFSVAPKTKRIVDLAHKGAPYFIPAYEGLTASKAVAVINQLFGAFGIGKKEGDPYGGWIRPQDKNWRMAFKKGEYKRFKLEQIQIGSKANYHLGECRIIPGNFFDELTKARKPTAERG